MPTQKVYKYALSAIVSTYNAERLIRGCLESLERQTIADRLEIIVIDAASQEDERSIVKEFQQRYDNIRYYRLDTRETVYQAWNRGIRLARGKYITNANTDDRLRKDALERLVSALEENSEMALAYGNCLVTETENERFELCTPIGTYRMPDFSRNNLLNECIVGPQPVWRKALHDELGYFDEQYRCGADYEFWLRISERYNLLHVRDCLGLYMVNKNGVSIKGDQPRREMVAIQESYKKRFSTIPHLKSGEIELFRMVHRLHMEKPFVSVLFSSNVPKALFEDLLRLPGLNIREMDTKGSPDRWDIALIDVFDAEVPFLITLMTRRRFKYLGISGLKNRDLRGVSPEFVETLQQFGCTKVSPGCPVYEWRYPTAFGTALYKSGSVDEGMAFLGKLLASDPTDTELLNTLSRIAFENGMLDSSEAFALKAARLDRRHTGSLINLVKINATRGRYDPARKMSRYVVGIDKTKQPLMNEILGPQAAYESSLHTSVNSDCTTSRKILIINNLYPPQELGGYGRNIADFASLLEERGHEIHVLTSDTRYLGMPSKNDPHVRRELHLCGVYDEKGQHLFDREKIESFIRMNQDTIDRTLKKLHPDICLTGNIDLLGIPVFEPLFDQHIPILHYLGNEFPAYNPSDYPRDPHYHVITASHWLKQDAIRRGYPLEAARVVYPGAFVKCFKMAVPPATDILRIAYAGLITDSKGPQVLIQALHTLSKKGIDFRCSIAGGTINKRFLAGLEGIVQDLGLADRICFHGQLDRNGLKALFAKSNVLVFPSLANETFGISQVEGMAAGLLIITSGPGGAREVIEDGKSGLFFEPGKSDHLVEHLIRLTQDPLGWEQIALAGQRRAMEVFDIERSVDKLESLFSRISTKRRTRSKAALEVEIPKALPPLEGSKVADDIGELRPLRKQLAHLWLNTPVTGLQGSYEGNPGKWHRRFSLAQFKSYPLTSEEQALVDQQKDRLRMASAQEDDSLNHFLAAMLYVRPYQLPAIMDFEKVPAWFQEDYMKFLLECPEGVLKEGELDEYHRHIKQVTLSLAECIRDSPQSKRWATMAAIFAQRTAFAPLYFTRHSLKDIYASRSQILEYAWRLLGWQLDANCPAPGTDERKIRLGIFLTNLNSVTEMQATLPLFEWIDRNYFEVCLYVCVQKSTQQEAYCRNLVDHFTVLPEDVSARAEDIRSDELDILIFGNNTTTGVNSATILASHRLARFQCVHFCSPVTTGLKHIDYFLLGTLIDPEGDAEEAYTERIVRIPGSGICFSKGPQSRPKIGRFCRGNFGISEDTRVMVSGANFYKITPELRHIWARIVAAVPDSVLVLYPFGPAWSQKYPYRLFTAEMENVFGSHGLDKGRLIILKPFENGEDIPSFLRLADVYLDATPYSGATSLLDPLEAGIPPVVTEGPELRFCQGAAMLRELGVPDLITKDEASYIDLAIRLAVDDQYRNEMSTKIREKMAQGPAFLDSRAYGEKVSRVFESIVKKMDLDWNAPNAINGVNRKNNEWVREVGFA